MGFGQRRWGLAIAVLAVVLGGAIPFATTRSDPTGGSSASPAQQSMGSGGATSSPAAGGARSTTCAPGRRVNALHAGAAGDGHTDDTSALRHALAGLSKGDCLELPAGHTFAHRGMLRVRTPGITITGGGILLATNQRASTLDVAADRVTVSRITVATAHTTRRWAAPQQTGIWLNEHRDITLTDVTVDGSGSAGVFVQGTQHFTLTRVRVRHTRADGIHMTDGARYGLVTDAHTRNTGDDGVAVVAYLADRAQTRDIQIVSPHVRGQTHGRGVSVVGGRNVRITDVDIRDSSGAGVYIACERGEFRTHVPSHVTVSGGRLDGANQDRRVDQGSVLIYNGQRRVALKDVLVQDLRIHDTRASASWQVGLIARAPGPLRRIDLSDLHFTGPGPRTLLATSSNARYVASGWTENGKAVDV